MAEEVSLAQVDPEFRMRVTSRSKYPWDEWINGNPWVATRGEDFHVACANFVATLHQKATSRGITVKTSTTGDKVTFQFLLNAD